MFILFSSSLSHCTEPNSPLSLSPSSSSRSFSLKKPWLATVNCCQLSLPLTYISSFSFSAPSPRSPWSSSSGLLSLRFQGEQTWGFWDLRRRFGDHRWASNRGLTISIWWWVCCIIDSLYVLFDFVCFPLIVFVTERFGVSPNFLLINIWLWFFIFMKDKIIVNFWLKKKMRVVGFMNVL